MNSHAKFASSARLILGAATFLLISTPSQSAESCVSDWGAAGAIVRQQGLQTIEQLKNTGPNGIPGQIVQATLCQSGAAYVYRLVVRDPRGALKNVVVQANGSPGNEK